MKKVREDERELKEEREGRKRHKSGVQRSRETWMDREREREGGEEESYVPVGVEEMRTVNKSGAEVFHWW